MKGGTMHPATPARLSTSAILDFEYVKFFKKSGKAPVCRPQKNWTPNHPIPSIAILAGVTFKDLFTGAPSYRADNSSMLTPKIVFRLSCEVKPLSYGDNKAGDVLSRSSILWKLLSDCWPYAYDGIGFSFSGYRPKRWKARFCRAVASVTLSNVLPLGSELTRQRFRQRVPRSASLRIWLERNAEIHPRPRNSLSVSVCICVSIPLSSTSTRQFRPKRSRMLRHRARIARVPLQDCAVSVL